MDDSLTPQNNGRKKIIVIAVTVLGIILVGAIAVSLLRRPALVSPIPGDTSGDTRVIFVSPPPSSSPTASASPSAAPKATPKPTPKATPTASPRSSTSPSPSGSPATSPSSSP